MAGGLVDFTDDNFETEVLQSDQPVLVDFWAPWCGPCLRLGPKIEALAGEFEGKVKVGKVNVDENQQSAMKYRVMNIPTMLVVKGGQVVETLQGDMPKERIADALNRHVG